MKMKTRKTRCRCQRKQSLSPNRSNCLDWHLLKNWFCSPPPMRSTSRCSGLWVTDQVSLHARLLLIKCQYHGAGGERSACGRKTWCLWALQLDHGALFSGKEMETKSQQGRGFVSSTLHWLVSCYNQNMLSWTMFKTRKNGPSAVILQELRMPAVSLCKETCLQNHTFWTF